MLQWVYRGLMTLSPGNLGALNLGIKQSTQTGATLVLVGMAIIGLIDNFVVEIAKYAGLWQFHFVRGSMALPMLIAVGLIFGQSLFPQRYWAVALRSGLLAASMLLYFGSIPAMSISLVIAGLFTSPVFVLIFSRIFFGVRVGKVRIVAVLLGFIGVLAVLNPFGESFTPALILPIFAGALYALSAIVARRYCENESTIAMLFVFFLTLLVMGLIGLVVLQGTDNNDFLSRGWTQLTMPFLSWTLLQAAGSIVAVGLLTFWPDLA